MNISALVYSLLACWSRKQSFPGRGQTCVGGRTLPGHWAACMGPRKCPRLRCPSPRTPPSCPTLSSPARPHTRAAGHAHADLRVPTVQEAGGGEHSESRPLPKSIGILSPPGPHLRLWRSQQQVRVPTPHSLTLGRLLSTTEARGWSWGTALNPPLSLQLLLPPFFWAGWGRRSLRGRGGGVGEQGSSPGAPGTGSCPRTTPLGREMRLES